MWEEKFDKNVFVFWKEKKREKRKMKETILIVYLTIIKTIKKEGEKKCENWITQKIFFKNNVIYSIKISIY